MVKKYRPCAGAVVFNKKGEVLVCDRIDTKTSAWQFPQGGIEKGETALEAAKRELFEETNIVSVIPVYTLQKSICYDFPLEIKEKLQKKGILNDGQEICFSLFFFTGNDAEINLETQNPEFRNFAWKSFDFAIQNIVPFKKEVYALVAQEFLPIIEQYLCRLT